MGGRLDDGLGTRCRIVALEDARADEHGFGGSGIFKSDDPAPRAKAIVEATTHFRDADILAKVSRGLGAPMTGIAMDEINQRYAERGW